MASNKKSFRETAKTGALAWFLQRISAIVLFILLIYHFIHYHFLGQGVVLYEDVVALMKSPWFNLLQFLFLTTALFHGFNGVWSVVEDYVHSRSWRFILFGLILTIAFSMLFIGMMTIYKTVSI